MTADLPVEQQFAGQPFAGVNVRVDGQPVVARGERVARLEGNRPALKADDGAGDDDVAFVVGVQLVRAILLQLPVHRKTDRLNQARLDGLVLKRIYLDGSMARALAVGRAKPVGATIPDGRGQGEAGQKSQAHVTSFASW